MGGHPQWLPRTPQMHPYAAAVGKWRGWHFPSNPRKTPRPRAASNASGVVGWATAAALEILRPFSNEPAGSVVTGEKEMKNKGKK